MHHMKLVKNENVIKFYDYGVFAYNAYFKHEALPLPDGWKVFRTCPERFQYDGYYGKVYYKLNEKQKTIELLVSHRGTNNLYGLLEDSELCLMHKIPQQFFYGAKPFLQDALKDLRETYPDFNIIKHHHTGHSSGSVITELMVAFYGEPLEGVTFETPGAKTLIENLIKNKSLPLKALKYAADHVTSIKTNVNCINSLYPTVSHHNFCVPVPDAYPVYFNMSWLPLFPNFFYYATEYTFRVKHPMEHILDALDMGIQPIPAPFWVEGIENSYKFYLNYKVNSHYWEGYISNLWNNNGVLSELLHLLFFENFDAFRSYYVQYLECVQTNNFSNLPVMGNYDIRALWYVSSNQFKSNFHNNKETFIIWFQSQLQGFFPRQQCFQDKQPDNNIIENINKIERKFKTIQYNYKDIVQDSQRKQVIKDLIAACLKAKINPSEESYRNLIRLIQEKRDETQKHHEGIYNKLGFFGSFIKHFRKSRTVTVINDEFKEYLSSRSF